MWTNMYANQATKVHKIMRESIEENPDHSKPNLSAKQARQTTTEQP